MIQDPGFKWFKIHNFKRFKIHNSGSTIQVIQDPRFKWFKIHNFKRFKIHDSSDSRSVKIHDSNDSNDSRSTHIDSKFPYQMAPIVKLTIFFSSLFSVPLFFRWHFFLWSYYPGVIFSVTLFFRCGKLKKLILNNNRLVTLPDAIHYLTDLEVWK